MDLINYLAAFFMHCPHTKQCTAVDKSLRHQEIQISQKKSWEHRESNQGPLGAKRERYPLCYVAPSH